MQVREWLISKSFFMIESTFFDIKTGECTYFTSSSIHWLFHFFSKVASTWRSHSRRFFALSARRRWTRSAALAERHSPPRTRLRANKSPGVQLAHYKLDRHKRNIGISAAYRSPTVSINHGHTICTDFCSLEIVYSSCRRHVAPCKWGLCSPLRTFSALWTAAAWTEEFSSLVLLRWLPPAPPPLCLFATKPPPPLSGDRCQ